jgi:tetratricopeptide (TPR) repeat protein
MLMPVGLNFVHDFPFYRSLTDPEVLFSLLLHAVILSTAVYLLFSMAGRPYDEGMLARIAGFGIAWFYLTLAVECSVLPIDDHYHEYRIYLPAFGYLLSIVALLCLVIRRWNGSRVVWLCGNLLVITIVVMFSLLTLLRNEQWRDPLVFWQDALSKSPGKQRIHGYIGNVYRDRGDIPRALREYRLMLAKDFRYGQDHFHLGEMLHEHGFYQEAVEEYLIALKIRPDKLFVYRRLAELYDRMNEKELAAQARSKVAGSDPVSAVSVDGEMW